MNTINLLSHGRAIALLVIIALFSFTHTSAQNEVAIGSATTKSNAILWLNGNGSQGLILPTVTNKSAVNNPDQGMIVYDNSDNKVWYRSNNAWVEVGGGSGAGDNATLNLLLSGNQLQLRDGTAVLNSVNIAGGTQAAGAFMVFQNGSWQFATLSGDVTGANGALQVNGLRGKTIATLPASTQALVYDPTANSGAGGFVFQALSVGGGITSITGTAPVTVAGTATIPVISLANAGITNTLLADNSVTSAKIADATITGTDIAATTITGNNIVNTSITTDKLARSNATDNQVLQWNGNNWVPVTLEGGGTVTSVTAGTGLTGGTITTIGTINVDVGTTANKIVQLDGTGKLPAVDGSQLTNLPVGGDITAVTAGNGLTGGGVSGDVSLAVDAGTTANKIVQLDGTGKLPAVDGSQLLNVGDIKEVTAGTGLSGGGTTGTVTLNLANTTVSPNTYGSPAAIPQITVDAQGRITNATTIAPADDSPTNELQNLSFTGNGTGATGENFQLNISSGTGVTIREGANIQIEQAANVITINSVAGGSGTVTNVTGTAPIGVVDNSTTPVISITQATSSTDGYLSSADWSTFNNKGSGTVTNVTGTAPINVATGTTTPVISLANTAVTPGSYGTTTSIPQITVDAQGRITGANNQTIPTANTTTTGLLTGTDWTTFNGKMANPLSTTGDLIYGTGSTPTRLAVGSDNQVLTVISGLPSWANAPGASGVAGGDLTGTYPNPSIAATTTAGNNIITAVNAASTSIAGLRVSPTFGTQNIATSGTLSAGATTVTGLTIGTTAWPANANGVLTNNAGVLSWNTPFTNPMTTQGDLIVGGVSGAATRLAAPAGSRAILGYNGTTQTWVTGTPSQLLGTDVSGNLTFINQSGFLSSAVPVPIANGGTNAITEAGARTNLGLGSLAVLNEVGSTEITDGSITGTDLAPDIEINTSGNISTNGTLFVGGGVSALAFGQTDGVALRGTAQNNSNSSTGVFGVINTAGNTSPVNIGARGYVDNTSVGSQNYGLMGTAISTGAINYGVYGLATGATTNWAGYFQGNTTITGQLAVGATPNFGTDGQVLTSKGPLSPPEWQSASGSNFSLLNTIPKGDGTTLVSSNISDDGTTTSIISNSIGNPTLIIRNQNGGGINGTLSGTKGGLVLATETGSGQVTGFETRTGGVGSGTTYTGLFASAENTGSSVNYAGQFRAEGSTSQNIAVVATADQNAGANYGLFSSVGGTQTNDKYGVFINMLGNGTKYGVYAVGENINYFSGNVGVGTLTPASKLDISGDLNISTGSVIKYGGTTIISLPSGTGGDNLVIGKNPPAGLAGGQGFNVIVGQNALNAGTPTARANVAIGYNAQQNTTTAIDQIAIGVNSLLNNTTGSFNTTVGAGSLRSITTASDYNTAIGWHAGINFTSGNFNTFLGETTDAAAGLTNATAIGSRAFVTQSNSIVLGSINGTNGATSNTRVGIGTTAPTASLDIVGNIKITDGTQANGRVLTSDANGLATWQPAGAGTGWTLVGNNALATDFIGTTNNIAFNIRVGNQKAGRIDFDGAGDNVSLGYQALNLNTANNNVAIGTKALQANTTSPENTGIGRSALFSTASGFGANTAMGSQALYQNTSGYRNTAIGYLAGSTTVNPPDVAGVGITTGNNNTFIGSVAGPLASGTITNATAIGANAKVDASNKIRLGDANVTVIQGQVAFTNASDRRLKNTVREIDYGLDFIKKLVPVSYRMNNSDERENWGFIAQDIEAMVGTDKAVLTIGQDSDRTLGLRYTDFIAPMVKAMQEQQLEIETLKAQLKEKDEKVNLLEGSVNTMKSELDVIKKALNINHP